MELYEQISREYEHGSGTIREVSRKLGGAPAGGTQGAAERDTGGAEGS
jgi:hypothetical protein